MELEKLKLLEEKLGRFIGDFNRLREEKNLLERRLEDEAGRWGELEREVGELRRERDVIRDRLGRLLESLDRLEALEAGEAGGEP